MAIKTPNHSGAAHHHVFPAELNPTEYFTPGFGLGRPDSTQDIIYQGARRMYWESSPDDDILARYAGWQDRRRFDEHGNEYLDIPVDMRRASAVLSGKEAWAGEKNEVLQGVARYIARVGKDLGQVDISLSFDTIGVERGGLDMIAAPPHRLVNDPNLVGEWADNLYNDAQDILSNDPPEGQEELLGFLRASLSELSDIGLL